MSKFKKPSYPQVRYFSALCTMCSHPIETAPVHVACDAAPRLQGFLCYLETVEKELTGEFTLAHVPSQT